MTIFARSHASMPVRSERRPDERVKRDSDGEAHEQAVASLGVSSVRGAVAHPEAEILLVPEGLLDREPSVIELDDFGGHRVLEVGREKPRLVHRLRAHRDDGANGRLVCGNARPIQPTRATVRSEPFRCRLLHPVVRNQDPATKPDYVAPLEYVEHPLEDLITKASVGEHRAPDLR